MDEVVFQRFVDGDDAAFTFIYNKYVDLLLQYGRSLGFEKEVLNDAIQDVFVKLYLNRRSLSEVRNLKYYLFSDLFRHPVVRAYEIHSSFGHKEHDRLQSEPHSASVGRVHTVKGNVYRVVEC